MPTKQCSVEGCERDSLARGWCSPHWKRWRKYGDPLGKGPVGRPGDKRSFHPLYGIYMAMIHRCYNEAVKSYHNYGGRGIYVCNRWKDDFWAFAEDMTPRPEGASLERVDNDGPYSPDNCVWADAKAQANNRRERVLFRLERCPTCGHVI